MRPTFLQTAALLAAALSCTPAVPASVLEFDVWMRAIDKHSVEVQKLIARREAEGARQSAAEIARLYALMERYFEADRPAADARDLSRTGREDAQAISTALETGDFANAADAARRVARACNDCHDLHKPFQ